MWRAYIHTTVKSAHIHNSFLVETMATPWPGQLQFLGGLEFVPSDVHVLLVGAHGVGKSWAIKNLVPGGHETSSPSFLVPRGKRGIQTTDTTDGMIISPLTRVFRLTKDSCDEEMPTDWMAMRKPQQNNQ